MRRRSNGTRQHAAHSRSNQSNSRSNNRGNHNGGNNKGASSKNSHANRGNHSDNSHRGNHGGHNGGWDGGAWDGGGWDGDGRALIPVEPIVPVDPVVPVVPVVVDPRPAVVTLMNPAQTQTSLNYTLGESQYVIAAGETSTFEEGTQVIAFDRGGSFGEARYTLAPARRTSSFPQTAVGTFTR